MPALLMLVALLAVAGCAGSRPADVPAAASSQAPPATQPDLAHKSARVDAIMAPWNREDRPGAAVVVLLDGRMVHSRGYGLASRETGERFTPRTPSLIGSVAKMFTAMAVMLLAEEGRLGYDDALSKFFPGLPPARQAITLRHLLNHTSALPQYEDFLKSRGVKAEALPPSDAVAAYLRWGTMRFRPGDKWEYCNGGYVVLSRVVEEASGESFAGFVRRRIFEPLGMHDSFFVEEPRARAGRRATGYYREWYGLKVSETLEPLRLYNGAGSIFSTVEDLARWDQALATDRLVTSRTLEEAFTGGPLNDGTRLLYGFGWDVFSHKGVKYVTHAGGWAGFKAFILRFPGQRFTVIALSNSGQFDIQRVPLEITKVYLSGQIDVPPKIVSAD
jgi:CubicO group peptidase (beta-lactamase class C family)